MIIDVNCRIALCTGDGALPAELEVVDLTTGLAVPGSVVDTGTSSRGLITWKPDAELVSGRSYSVTWPTGALDPNTEVDLLFHALPAIEGDASLAELGVTLAAQTDFQYERVVCQLDSSASAGLCTNQHVIGTKTKRYVSLEVSVGADELLAAQLVIHTTFWADGEPEPQPDVLAAHRYGSLTASTRFDSERAAYCYRVEIESLIDGSTATHEACIAHGTLGALDETPVSAADVQSQMGHCAMPPAGNYMAEWCSGRLDYCASNARREPSCASAETACAEIIVDEPEPMLPVDPDPNEPSDPDEPNEPRDPGTGGAPDVSGDDGAAGAAGMSGETDEPRRETRTACAVSAVGRGHGSFEALLGLFALLWCARRR